MSVDFLTKWWFFIVIDEKTHQTWIILFYNWEIYNSALGEHNLWFYNVMAFQNKQHKPMRWMALTHYTQNFKKMQSSSIHTLTFVTTASTFSTVSYMDKEFCRQRRQSHWRKLLLFMLCPICTKCKEIAVNIFSK